MKVHSLSCLEIQFEPCAFEDSLSSSLLRIGCSFPLHVELREDGYHCIDGHKRLSALLALHNQNKLPETRYMVPVMVVNRGDLRTTPHHGMRNHH